MNILLNLIWFICCGFWQGLSWVVIGALWSLSIVGLPVGYQCFKLAHLTFFPFGKEVVYREDSSLSTVANVLWIIFGGLPIALVAITNGLVMCCTIIGIPFGLQSFKIARLSLMPFGASMPHC